MGKAMQTKNTTKHTLPHICIFGKFTPYSLHPIPHSPHPKNTHQQCVLPTSKIQTTCKQANRHFQYTMRVCIPQCRDARLERPLNRKVEKKHNHLSLHPKLPKTQTANKKKKTFLSNV